MDDAEECSVVPTSLDLKKMEDLQEDGRLQNENDTWVLLRYPVSPLKAKCPGWCQYSLIVTCRELPEKTAPYELKTLKGVLAFLEQLEEERLKKRK